MARVLGAAAAVWGAVGGGGFVGDRLAGVGPVEGAGHRGVEVLQELAQLGFEVGYGCEVSAAHHFSHHDAEEDLDLVQSRAVFGQEHEADAMARVREKAASAGLVFQVAVFPFFFPSPDPVRKRLESIRPGWPTKAR